MMTANTDGNSDVGNRMHIQSGLSAADRVLDTARSKYGTHLARVQIPEPQVAAVIGIILPVLEVLERNSVFGRALRALCYRYLFLVAALLKPLIHDNFITLEVDKLVGCPDSAVADVNGSANVLR